MVSQLLRGSQDLSSLGGSYVGWRVNGPLPGAPSLCMFTGETSAAWVCE